MPRVNVWLPDELFARLRDLDHVNVSRLLQEKIRELLRCDHSQLACRDCAEPIDKWALINERMAKFYADLLWALRPLVDAVGTAEGACRVIKDVAVRYQVPGAATHVLPRPGRKALEAAGHTHTDRKRRAKTEPPAVELPREADSRRRHPTARTTTAPATALPTPDLDVEETA